MANRPFKLGVYVVKTVGDQLKVCPHATEFGNAVGDNFTLVERAMEMVWGSMRHIHTAMRAEVEVKIEIRDAVAGRRQYPSAAELGTYIHAVAKSITGRIEGNENS